MGKFMEDCPIDVLYELNGGVVSTELPAYITASYTLPTPTREGYIFIGWYDNAEGEGTPLTVLPAGYKGSVYAKWIILPDGAIVFDADIDQGNAGTDSNNATAYQITKNGVTVEVSCGVLGTYYNEMHYRIFKNHTLTVTSASGNIAKVEFVCVAIDDTKYGPGCFIVGGGSYEFSGAVGTWTGDAASVTFAASANQVRATQIVVTLVGTTDVENVVVGQTPTKIIENGQVLIIRGENIYNILGTQVK
jgi:uncharacterized repeat protein (TIGR02543 family)